MDDASRAPRSSGRGGTTTGRMDRLNICCAAQYGLRLILNRGKLFAKACRVLGAIRCAS
jgi:hypothetical protein